MKKVLIGIGAALLTMSVVGGVGRAAYVAGRDDARKVKVVHVDGTSTPADSDAVSDNGYGPHFGYYDGDRGHHGGPFMVLPLILVGGGLIAVGLRRRNGGCNAGPRGPHGWGPGNSGGPGNGWGPGNGGGPQAFLNDWHRQAHANDEPATATPSTPEAPATPEATAAPSAAE